MVSKGKSRLSKVKQDRLIEHFVAGTTARCTSALVRVNSKTAVYYFHRLREIIAYQLEQEVNAVFSGEIEVDESYFGSKRKGKRGRGAAELRTANILKSQPCQPLPGRELWRKNGPKALFLMSSGSIPPTDEETYIQ